MTWPIRPAIVRLTLGLPRWWRCELAHLSMRLDDRWQTGYWTGDLAPAAPEGLCDVCQRRAAWLVIGGRDEDEPTEYPDDYLFDHPLHVCAWCRLDLVPIRNRDDLERAVQDARARSVAWRWRWRPV
jgi:hypothetical protein